MSWIYLQIYKYINQYINQCYSFEQFVYIDMCFILEASNANTCKYNISSLIQSMFAMFWCTSQHYKQCVIVIDSTNPLKKDSEIWFIYCILCYINSTRTDTISLWRNFYGNIIKHKRYAVSLTLIIWNKVVFLYAKLGIPIRTLIQNNSWSIYFTSKNLLELKTCEWIKNSIRWSLTAILRAKFIYIAMRV